MLETFNCITIGAIELLLACMVLHRTVPAKLHCAKSTVLAYWSLGLCLGMLGISHMFTKPMQGMTLSFEDIVANYALIAFASEKYARTIRETAVSWWNHI